MQRNLRPVPYETEILAGVTQNKLRALNVKHISLVLYSVLSMSSGALWYFINAPQSFERCNINNYGQFEYCIATDYPGTDLNEMKIITYNTSASPRWQ